MRCSHGKLPTEDCLECDLDAYGRDMSQADSQKKKRAPQPAHAFYDAAYPERKCSICGGKYRGPLSVCSQECENQSVFER